MPVSYGKGARAKATKLHSQLVRERGVCQRCYRRPPDVTLQCAHIIGRGRPRTRTLLDNAWSLCVACHMRVDQWWDEKMQLVRDTIGEKRYYELKLLAESTDGQRFDWPAELKRLEEVAAWSKP